MFERICIATFSVYKNKKRTAINGMVEPLLSFFLPRTHFIDLIDGPHPGSSRVATIVEEYKNGKLKQTTTSWIGSILSPLLSMQNSKGTQLFFKLRDLLSVVEWAIRQPKKYDLFIGLESVFAISGIMLKRLGKTQTVIYYVSDYSPKRYPQKWLNDLYLWLDRFCCYNADIVWDVSPAMLPARIKAGLDKKKCKPVILVPNALFSEQQNFRPIAKRQKNSLVFAGTFGFENGTKLAIESMKYVVKEIPDATLHFYGGNKELEEELRKIAHTLNLSEHISFHGFITDAVALSKTINKYMLGLAPYTAIPNSPRWYADATKIRLYFGAGLPVITTPVPPLGKETERKGAAVIAEDDPKQYAKAVVRILTNDETYQRMAKAATAFAKENTWENTYKMALLTLNNIRKG